MSRELINAYNNAKREIARTIEFLKENENVWNEARTLKLHDLSFKYNEIMDKYPHCKADDTNDENSYFYRFCDNMYDSYHCEWVENGVDDLLCYVGRTSTFYITDISEGNRHTHNTNYGDVLYNVTYACSCGDMFDFVKLDNNGKMVSFYGDIATQIDYLEYIASDLYDNVYQYLYNAIVLADGIDAFLNNQIQEFKEWIDFYEQDLAFYESEENKRIAVSKGKLKAIFDSYGVSVQDREQILALA